MSSVKDLELAQDVRNNTISREVGNCDDHCVQRVCKAPVISAICTGPFTNELVVTATNHLDLSVELATADENIEQLTHIFSACAFPIYDI